MKRVGFTLLELIFVIVIIGIVGTMVTEIITNVYRDYILSYRVNEMQQKSEYLLEQIAGRLKYRIKDSTITREVGNDNIYGKLTNAEPDSDKIYTMEWIGYSNEALRELENNKMGYSAFIDIQSSETNRTQFKTSGSDLDLANVIFKKLSRNRVDLELSTNPAGLYMATVMPKEGYWGDVNDTVFEQTTFRVNKGLANNILLILDNPTKPRDLNEPIDIYERYYLAWSAYAIVPYKSKTNCETLAGNNDMIFDLCLVSNYQPWNGGKYTDSNSTKSILMENVTSFRFRAVDQFIRVKVCINDGNTTGKGLDIQKGGNSALGFCKEKGIF